MLQQHNDSHGKFPWDLILNFPYQIPAKPAHLSTVSHLRSSRCYLSVPCTPGVISPEICIFNARVGPGLGQGLGLGQAQVCGDVPRRISSLGLPSTNTFKDEISARTPPTIAVWETNQKTFTSIP